MPELEALFAAVYAAPDDDAPRRVLADALLERGDPRGELISLQLAGSNPQRVTELLEAHAEQWLGGLADAAEPRNVVFNRGFPETVSLAHATVRLREPVPCDEWLTVRHVRTTLGGWTYTGMTRTLVDLLTASHARFLESVRWVRPGALLLLCVHTLPWRELGLDTDIPHELAEELAQVPLPACLARFPKLELLEVKARFEATLHWVLDPAVAKCVKRLRVMTAARHADAWRDGARAAGFRLVQVLV